MTYEQPTLVVAGDVTDLVLGLAAAGDDLDGTNVDHGFFEPDFGVSTD